MFLKFLTQNHFANVQPHCFQKFFYELIKLPLRQKLRETVFPIHLIITSRERPKSAPYLRLKNTKRASKCHSNGDLGTLLWKNFWRKVSQCRKKLKVGTLWHFSTSILSENIKKLKGALRWKQFFGKKVSQSQKYSKGVPFGPVEFLRWCKNTTS